MKFLISKASSAALAYSKNHAYDNVTHNCRTFVHAVFSQVSLSIFFVL